MKVRKRSETVQQAPVAGRPAEAPPDRTRRQRRIALAAVGIATLLVTALLAFGLTRDPSQLRSNLTGKPAPDFTLRTLDGSRTIHLADLRGQIVVLNFWASWCAECRIEDPEIKVAWQRYQDQGVVFLGISFQDSVSNAEAYAIEEGLAWPLVADPDSSTALAYGISGVPETIFIGRDGRVIHKQIGRVSYGLLVTDIDQLLEHRT
mgnify:CR=1 FL=1